MLKQVLYSSQATIPITSKVLGDILEAAVRHNSVYGITGFLVYQHDQFMQILEGKEQDVDEVMRIIKKDSRHEDVTILFSQSISERDFPLWMMGFKNLDQYPNIKDEDNVFTLDILDYADRSKAIAFIKGFISIS